MADPNQTSDPRSRLVERLCAYVKRIYPANSELKGLIDALIGSLPQAPETKGYQGPIEVGMHFIWEPSKPRAWAHVVVEEIRTVEGRERMIRTGQYWNDESRFREACVPCDEHGRILPAAPQVPGPEKP